MINWSDEKAMVSRHFTVKEALFLPSWGRMATEADGLTLEVKEHLITLCQKLDEMRDYFKAPIEIHVMFRPAEYNKLVKGAKNSAHLVGKAADFDVKGMDCDDVRAKIVSDGKLEQWNMRMEDNKGGTWIHLDIAPVGPSGRVFKP